MVIYLQYKDNRLRNELRGLVERFMRNGGYKMDKFVVNIIHRPEMVPEYSATVTG